MFDIGRHADHPRLCEVRLSESGVQQWLAVSGELDTQSLEFVPFHRFILARHLQTVFGGELVELLRRELRNRQTGGVALRSEISSLDQRAPEACLKIATAIAYCVGLPNFDAMTGKYYARFAVQHTDDSDSYLRKAYRDMTLHTDGTYVAEATDWLLMMKTAERHATGGRSRLLHLDDWESLDRLRRHALAERPLLYQSPPSKNVTSSLRRPTFYQRDGHTCLAFIDQFAYPENMEEAVFLYDLAQSLETSPAVACVPIRVGELLLLNNHFWLHGREAFAPHAELYRELIRLRGRL